MAVYVMITLLVAGFLLLAIGFTNRAREWGVWLIGIGVVSMFTPLVYKVFLELS
jgi:hypothetical protein